MERFISFFGLLIIVGVGFLLSESRRKIKWKKNILMGVLLQILFAWAILKTPWGKAFFNVLKEGTTAIVEYSNVGSRFIFGDLSDASKVGFVVFTMVLPSIVFVASLMSVLYHWGIMQIIIKGFARLMVRLMGVSGGESLAAAANVFVGQTEAYLVIRPLLARLTRSELLSLMTGGMATVAGGVLAAYVNMGVDAGHLLAASVMSAPAALVCAKLLIPETEKTLLDDSVEIMEERKTVNFIDAAASGAAEGVRLMINVGAMLLAFIALIAMINGMLSYVGGWVGFPGLSMELISGYLFAPVAFLLGIPWEDCLQVGSLLGKKMILNEFVAYLDLQKITTELSPRSVIISTYALCGFANFGSIAIQIGGMGTLVPERRHDLARLGIKSLLAGTMACLMTACVAGLFV